MSEEKPSGYMYNDETEKWDIPLYDPITYQPPVVHEGLNPYQLEQVRAIIRQQIEDAMEILLKEARGAGRSSDSNSFGIPVDNGGAKPV